MKQETDPHIVAGATGLEPATSCVTGRRSNQLNYAPAKLTSNDLQRLALLSTSFDVTVSGLSVLSTTWKSTDGTASHWKYVADNVIVYRDVYRAQRALNRLR
jgi:hypothetical protein